MAALAIQELQEQVAALGQATPDLLGDLLPGIIASFSEAAAAVAVDWYADHRGELGVAGNFVPFIPEMRDPGVPQMLQWAEREALTDLSRMKLIEGATIRRVENGARAAVIANVEDDPEAEGYQRYARLTNNGCGFCQALAGRGTVYRSDESASFGAHDNCKCVAVPAFSGAPIPVRPYEPSSRRTTDADRRRVREWLARRAAD